MHIDNLSTPVDYCDPDLHLHGQINLFGADLCLGLEKKSGLSTPQTKMYSIEFHQICSEYSH